MNKFGHRTWRTAAVVFVASALTYCGGDKKPASPTQPIVVPTTPPPSTPPTPGPPLSVSCSRLSPGATSGFSCRDGAPNFEEEVYGAIDTLKIQQPRIFNGDQVLDVGAYVVGLIKILDTKNLCADWDGEELAVARSNNLNDQYDVLTARSEARKYFVGTCWPSLVPLAHHKARPTPAGCNLPPSVELACGNPESRYRDKVLAAIDQIQKDKPELFDFSDRSPQGWPLVRDMMAYQNGVIDILTAQGFCGRFDGEEVVLKRTNDFTEHFDINYQDKYIRLGNGIYRGACYPAAF